MYLLCFHMSLLCTGKSSGMLEFLVGSITITLLCFHSNLLVTPNKVQLWSYYYGVRNWKI